MNVMPVTASRLVVKCAVAWSCAGLMIGCATSGSQHILRAEEQRAAATIVAGFSEIPATPLQWKASEVTTQMLDSGGQEKSFAILGAHEETEIVRMIHLPPWVAPYSINVTSFAVGGLADPALFYPRLMFLDSNFKRTRETRQSDFVYRNVGAQGGISTDVFVNEPNRGEAYLAILSENQSGVKEETSIMQSSGATPVAVPVGPYIVMWMVPTGGTELPKKLRALAVGPIRLRVAPYGRSGK